MLQKIGLMMQLSVQVVITFSSLPLATSMVIASMARATAASIGAVPLTSTAPTRTSWASTAASPAWTTTAVAAAACLGLQSSLSRTSEAHSIYLIYLINFPRALRPEGSIPAKPVDIEKK
jgi:hypothetical protein